MDQDQNRVILEAAGLATEKDGGENLRGVLTLTNGIWYVHSSRDDMFWGFFSRTVVPDVVAQEFTVRRGIRVGTNNDAGSYPPEQQPQFVVSRAEPYSLSFCIFGLCVWAATVVAVSKKREEKPQEGSWEDMMDADRAAE